MQPLLRLPPPSAVTWKVSCVFPLGCEFMGVCVCVLEVSHERVDTQGGVALDQSKLV